MRQKLHLYYEWVRKACLTQFVLLVGLATYIIVSEMAPLKYGRVSADVGAYTMSRKETKGPLYF